MIITRGGEIEAVSPTCSAPITTFPKFAGIGRTASLLDEELLLLGNDYLGSRGRYISIQKPRDGLLSMKYTVNQLQLTQPPHEHSSLVSRNTLTVIGGKFKSRAKFSKFTWTELSLKWQNGTKFIPSFSASCSVKLGIDIHIIVGGERAVDGQRVTVNQVVKINTTAETAIELSPITYSRVFHDCQLLNKSMILVSGGLARRDGNPSEILPDELYDLTYQRVDKVLNYVQSIRRAQHALVKIEDRIWALGGRDSYDDTPSKIAEFDLSTSYWNELTQELHSSNTSELIITPIPAASLDCVPQCQCGIPSKEGRIFGGSEAQVRNTCR